MSAGGDGGRRPIRWIDEPGGRGTKVVLLHGLGSSAEDWLFQVPALGRRHSVAAVDLPGHGGVPSLPGWPSVADYAAEVAAAMGERGAGPAHIVGLSLGGAVALQLAVDAPTRVRSLSLINTFAKFRLTFAAWLRGAVRLGLGLTGRMDWLGAWVASGLFPRPDQAALRQVAAARIAANDRRGYLQGLRAAARFDLGPRLGTIRVPTLVVSGTADTTVPTSSSRALASRIPGAQLQLLEGAGHVASVDAPEALNDMLLSFLEKVDAASGQEER
jgi:pimeloyl-ACP methyl ester carboxylesterase